MLCQFLFLSLKVAVLYAVGRDDCFLQTANTSLRACIIYLNALAASDLPLCGGGKDVCAENCGGTTTSNCPNSCAEVQNQGNNRNGIYKICLKPWFQLASFDVYCDLETEGGGWTVLQRRGNYSEPADSFYRNWTEYKNGFGNLNTQFWLGNDHLFALTNQDHTTLRIELTDFEGESRWAEYNDFRVENEREYYKISHLGNYSGTAGDSLLVHYGRAFYTKDRDTWLQCARDGRGGWWYSNCRQANLNGLYANKGTQQYSKNSREKYLAWGSFRGYEYSLKHTEMKIRPAYFLKG